MSNGKNLQSSQYAEQRDGIDTNRENDGARRIILGHRVDGTNIRKIIELFSNAMDELMAVIQFDEPLWFQRGATIVFNEVEYTSAFRGGLDSKPRGYTSDVSKETCLVKMNHMSIVEILMNVDQWADIFSTIVSRRSLLEVISRGVLGTYCGTLQVMSAEFQVPSPLVQTRGSYFVRYCKQHDEGAWAVVDISLDQFFLHNSLARYRRRASGCLIQEIPNGNSKVTWLEHAEVDDRSVNNIYPHMVNAGLAYGAKRWVYTLNEQCDRLLNVIATDPANFHNTVFRGPDGRKNMMQLAERMVKEFVNGVSASVTLPWKTLTENETHDIRVIVKSLDEAGKPGWSVLSAATSFRHSLPPRRIYDFLTDYTRRHQWDRLWRADNVEEITHVVYGKDPGNCVSLFRVNSYNRKILQETRINPVASYVVYAPVDNLGINALLSGGVSLLPHGFAILPDQPKDPVGGNSVVVNRGSLVTLMLQTPSRNELIGQDLIARIRSVNHIIDHIKASLPIDDI